MRVFGRLVEVPEALALFLFTMLLLFLPKVISVITVVQKTEDAARFGGRGAVTLSALAEIFFSALLPQFISPQSPVAPQVAILGVTSVVIEFFVLAAYGYLAGRAALVARQPRFVVATNRASGSMLVAAGAGLALTSER